MLVIGAGITELRWSKNQCRNSRNGGLSEWKAFFSMKKVPVFRPIEVNGSEWRPVGMAAWIVPWECRKIWGRGSRRSRRSRKTWLVRRRTGAMLSIYFEPDGEFSERTILYLIIFVIVELSLLFQTISVKTTIGYNMNTNIQQCECLPRTQ